MSVRKAEKHTICIIFPALNEESTIGKIIDEIPYQALEREGYQVEVVVVDNNCTDRTRHIAQAKGARVLSESRKGKGRAVRTALESVDADFIFMLDADYTYPAIYIPDMLEILRRDHSVVIGSRLRGKREKGAMRPVNLIGNLLLSFMASVLYQRRISDLCTGYWGIRGEVVRKLKFEVDGFQLESELFTELAKRGYRIADIPIHYRRRETHAKLNPIRDGIKIGSMLISRRF